MLGQDEIEFRRTRRLPLVDRFQASARERCSLAQLENTVINIQTNTSPLDRVTAVFADGSKSFPLPQGATFGQIADRIDRLGKRHERETVAVVVKFATKAPQAAAAPASPTKLPTPFRDGLLAEIPRLRAFARSMARNPDRADDLVQETLAKAWAHRSKFKEGTNLGAWLFTILRNTYYGELRSRRREVSDSNGHHAAQLACQPAQLHHLELQNVAHAFGEMTAGQREALYLVGVSGLTYEEAAQIAGCPAGTIKSRVFRARQVLLCKLGDQAQQLPDPDSTSHCH